MDTTTSNYSIDTAVHPIDTAVVAEDMMESTTATLPSGMILVEGYTAEHLAAMRKKADISGSLEYIHKNESILAGLPLEHVAVMFCGMGHGLGIYYDHLLGHFVIFHEGGSNGYDRLCNDDVKHAYLAQKTIKDRRDYMNARIPNGIRRTLEDDIYEFMMAPRDPEDAASCLWSDCVINPTTIDTKFSLHPERIRLLNHIANLEDAIKSHDVESLLAVPEHIVLQKARAELSALEASLIPKQKEAEELYAEVKLSREVVQDLETELKNAKDELEDTDRRLNTILSRIC